jgi:hypothetical protein
MGVERDEATDGEKRLVADIAASLETEMSTEPSAEFLARVRGRVAEERDRAATRWPASLSGAAASVAIALAMIGAISLGRVLRSGPDSGPAPTVPAATVAAAEAPSSGITVPSVLRAPAASTRHLPEPRTLAERPGPKAMLGANVLVDPGQREELAHLAERGFGTPILSMFVVETLDPTVPLPEVRPTDLPRFEPKRLEIKPGGGNDSGWEGSRWQGGGAASDSDEGSHS